MLLSLLLFLFDFPFLITSSIFVLKNPWALSLLACLLKVCNERMLSLYEILLEFLGQWWWNNYRLNLIYLFMRKTSTSFRINEQIISILYRLWLIHESILGWIDPRLWVCCSLTGWKTKNRKIKSLNNWKELLIDKFYKFFFIFFWKKLKVYLKNPWKFHELCRKKLKRKINFKYQSNSF